MGSAIRKCARRAVDHQARHFGDLCPGALFADFVGIAVADKRELAGIAAALMHNATDAARIKPAVDPVQHHFSHGKLPLDRFTPRLEIQRLRQTLPLVIAGGRR